MRERIFVENHAKNSSSIFELLKRHGDQESINGVIQFLALDGLEFENQFNSKNNDIYE